MLATVETASIHVGERMRSIGDDQVNSLMNSISEVGLLNPITVYGIDGGFGLVAGAHRLEACKRLGLVEIPAQVVTMNDLDRQIAECDENLCATNLTPSERAEFTARRKEAYEAKHPETKLGANQHTRVGEVCQPNFAQDQSAKTGMSARTVRQDAERGMKISEKALAALRGTTLDTGVYLDTIKEVPHKEQLARVKADLSNEQDRLRRNGISRRVRRAEPIHEDDSREKWLAAGISWWNRAPQEWRDEFLSTIDTPVFDRSAA